VVIRQRHRIQTQGAGVLIAPPLFGLSALLSVNPDTLRLSPAGLLKMLNNGVPAAALRCTESMLAPAPE
jgi:hypothetical protein